METLSHPPNTRSSQNTSRLGSASRTTGKIQCSKLLKRILKFNKVHIFRRQVGKNVPSMYYIFCIDIKGFLMVNLQFPASTITLIYRTGWSACLVKRPVMGLVS